LDTLYPTGGTGALLQQRPAAHHGAAEKAGDRGIQQVARG
jgi:hypothetical protein